MAYNISIISKVIFLSLLVYFPMGSMAQHGQAGSRQQDERMEAIESRRVAYITSRVSLTRQQARVFWPIYNEYNEKVEALGVELREKRLNLPALESLTEEQAAVYVEDELRRFEQSSALRREYAEKMLEVISIKQMALLLDAERSFNRMLFREAQRRMRPDGRGGQ